MGREIKKLAVLISIPPNYSMRVNGMIDEVFCSICVLLQTLFLRFPKFILRIFNIKIEISKAFVEFNIRVGILFH